MRKNHLFAAFLHGDSGCMRCQWKRLFATILIGLAAPADGKTSGGRIVKNASRILIAGSVMLVLLGIVWARELGSREARDRIAQALGIGDASRVHTKSI